jgi:hypothetical protein
METEELSIYRLISRRLVCLDELPFLNTLQPVAFWGLLVPFTDAHNNKMHNFWYQPIGVHCIVWPVKFEDGLFISVFRNKQLFTKK